MNLKACEIITKLNQESQNQKLRLFAKVDFEIKLKILTSQKQLFHKLKNNNSDVDNNILTLSSLILAIDSVVKELDDVNFNAIKLRGKKNTNKSKREKLLSYVSTLYIKNYILLDNNEVNFSDIFMVSTLYIKSYILLDC